MKNLPDIPKVCVLLRGGIELWIDAERRDALEARLKDSSVRFIKLDNQTVNTFEVLGIFTPDAIEERRRRKNGQWTCKAGSWHDKGDECSCLTGAEKEAHHKKREEFYKENGYYPLR